ncbi:predicted protein [Aspergillus terreus NIH2624]|uniref:Uncharacterized protein n=1 Tax=Aspergillus terreus (strain NIH 2624 / FGSC A1156) TaxID=341663 RepID=Q0CRU6_ASPTN|nr:uncharacterized protein ATEG_03588 [Aspergillus terreus NIH2624]EAU35390.1 predicted protein [Aspergillus terreus NIH2624]
MSFSDLPPEIVLQMASTLDSVGDICSLMSVNKGLYRLLKTYLYQYSVDHENSAGLIRAAGKGSLSAICCFLSLPRVNVHVRNDAGQTILHLAAQQRDGFYIMMILLRYNGMDVNATDSMGRTPLSYAASNDDCRPLSILLRRDDIDVNMTDARGRTPFSYAVDRGHKEAVQKLLDDTRLDPNRTSDDLSPLAIAAGSGSMEVLEMLLSDQRVALNNQIHGSIDPLIWALFLKHERGSLRLLCAPNLNVNCCWHTISALMWGILLRQTAVAVRILEKDQLDVNHQDNAGRTALMLAIQMENDEVSMTLLDRKDIDLTLEDERGESAVDYALKSGNSKMLGEIRTRL